MNISIFGLGYVGAVSAACLAESGNRVVGVDPNEVKVSDINAGRSPIVEAGLQELIAKHRTQGRLSATTSAEDAIRDTSISFVCVGTPSRANGSLNTDYIKQVCDEIGRAIKEKESYHTVVIRSTILPGTMRNLIIPQLEASSGLVAGDGFGLCNNPEFLREGTAIRDYNEPPKTVIGQIDGRAGDLLQTLYAGIDAPLIRTSLEVAEMVKYVDNTWHAVKVAFANEVGSLCKELDLDSHAVMDIFCQDTKLNLSSYYMKPGFPFGGSCLPKDVRALTHQSSRLDLDLPLLNAVLPSNRSHLDRCKALAEATPDKKIGIAGLSFKAGTDDLRESPMVELVEYLIGKGFDLRIYDTNVQLDKLTGANERYILEAIPHIAELLVSSLDELLDHSTTILIGNNGEEYGALFARMDEKQSMIDFVRLFPEIAGRKRYSGIAW